jgi:hypothetical protein
MWHEADDATRFTKTVKIARKHAKNTRKIFSGASQSTTQISSYRRLILLVAIFFGDHSEWHACSHCFWLLLHGWQCCQYLTSEVIFYHGFSCHLFLWLLQYIKSVTSDLIGIREPRECLLGVFGSLWVSLGFFGFLRVPLGFFGFLLVPFGFFGFLWVSLGILGESSQSHPEVIPHPWNGLGFWETESHLTESQ